MKTFAYKKGMTQIYKDGSHVAVTVIGLPKSVICSFKTLEKDGYSACVVGLVDEKKKISKPVEGQSKNSLKSRKLVECRIDENHELKIKDDVFEKMDLAEGDKVNVLAKSKGKGFQGTVKRHGFNTGPKTHGSHNYRAPGSIGGGYPQRVVKGQKMPGQMGAQTRTIKNLTIERIDRENREIWVGGSVPGANKQIFIIEK